MKSLLLFLLLSLTSAQKIEVNLLHRQDQNLIDLNEKLCASEPKDELTEAANLGVTVYSDSVCSILMDEDNQKTTDYDFIATSSFHQATQITTSAGNREGDILCAGDNDISNPKCILYKATIEHIDEYGDEILYDDCKVNIQGMGSSDSNPNDENTFHDVEGKITLKNLKILGSLVGTAIQTDHTTRFVKEGTGKYSCYFMPLNNKYVGGVDVIIRFVKTASTIKNGEVAFVQAKIPVKFIPHTARKLGSTSADQSVSNQHDAFVLMGKSKVNNLNDDKCQAIDGIDFIGMRRSDNVDLTDVYCNDGDMTATKDGSPLPQCSTKKNLLPDDSEAVLNTRSTGHGCKTSGSLPYLFTNAIRSGVDSVSLTKNLSPSYSNILTADGTAILVRVMGHFIDKRYLVVDQSGIETLEDNIGNFKINTQALNIKSNYLKVGHTRKVQATESLNLVKLNLDDYASECKKQIHKDKIANMDSTAANSRYGADKPNDDHILVDQTCEDVLDGDYAQYYFDHDHIIAYEHIKHLQDSYVQKDESCTSGGCKNTLILEGFNSQVVVKIPINVDATVPKAPWNVYIPKLDLQTIGDASVMKLTSDIRNPTYGLPVLDSSKEPQYADGYPLSHFFQILGVQNCENSDGSVDLNKCDEVDSYDDQYELFNRLNIISSGGDAESNFQEFWKSVGSKGTPILCSSNRASDDNANYGEGRVRDIGVIYRDSVTGKVSGSYVLHAKLYFDNCRIKVVDRIDAEGKENYMDQIIMSWNQGKVSNDARMCQDDEKTERIQITQEDNSQVPLPDCSSFVEPTTRPKSINYNAQTDQCTLCSKLTVIDRRKLYIGSTELSLLRRQEVFAGRGVQVQGSNIMFLLGKENEGDTSANVLEFDIWSTNGMQGYKSDATQCAQADTERAAGQVSPLCDEIHGCTLDSSGLFGSAISGYEDQCAEKKVKTPRVNGEFTFHTIRSTTQCNGKLDIQLRLRRSGDDDDSNAKTWNTNNLLNADGGVFTEGDYPSLPFLRPVYDVRFPCSRITKKTSDSIKLKFKFDMTYDLSSNQFTIKTEGISQLDGSDLSGSGNTWSSKSDASSRTGVYQKIGFTKQIEFKSVATVADNNILTCQNIDENGYDSVEEKPFGCTSNWTIGDPGKTSATVDADDCSVLKLVESGDNKSLQKEVSLALIYKRTYGYHVERDHLLDTKVADTDVEDVQYFCQDQKFKMSVNTERTAAVSVVTPIQLIVERKAQIVQIFWHGNNQGNTGLWANQGDISNICGEDQYELRILVKLEEQGTHSPNAKSDFKHIQDPDFTVSLVSSTDTLSAYRLVEKSGDVTVGTYAALKSQCIQVTAADCSKALASNWLDLIQTETTLLVQGKDSVLVGASGTNIVSDVKVSTDFESCPIDIDNVDVSDDFAVALSFQVDDNDNQCLSKSGVTALDTSNNEIINCQAALVTDTGKASLHSYVVESGNNVLTKVGGEYIAEYLDGAANNNNYTSPSAVKINTAKFSLKRYERSFIGGKGIQVGEPIDLCQKTGVDQDLSVMETPVLTTVFGGEHDLHVTASDFDCNFKLEAFGEADMLNDVFEVEVVVTFTNSARRLRASKQIKLKADKPSSASVGFQILSDTTTVTEDHSSSHSSQPSSIKKEEEVALPAVEPKESTPEKSHDHETEDATLLAILTIVVIMLVIAAIWYCFTRSHSSECEERGPYIPVATKENKETVLGGDMRFKNLRY